MRRERLPFILAVVSTFATPAAAATAGAIAPPHAAVQTVADRSGSAATARRAGQTSSLTSLCAGGAIAGVVTTARLGFTVATLEYGTLGAVAAASAGAGCVLAVVMQGVVVDCISGSLDMEPVWLFGCTVAAVEKLQGAADHAPATPARKDED